MGKVRIGVRGFDHFYAGDNDGLGSHTKADGNKKAQKKPPASKIKSIELAAREIIREAGGRNFQSERNGDPNAVKVFFTIQTSAHSANLDIGEYQKARNPYDNLAQQLGLDLS